MTRAEERRKAKESQKAGKVYQMTRKSLEATMEKVTSLVAQSKQQI